MVEVVVEVSCVVELVLVVLLRRLMRLWLWRLVVELEVEANPVRAEREVRGLSGLQELLPPAREAKPARW